MRTLVCFALVLASCTQFVQFDGGEDDASNRDGRVTTETTVSADVASSDAADAIVRDAPADATPVPDAVVVDTAGPDVVDVPIVVDAGAADAAVDAVASPDVQVVDVQVVDVPPAPDVPSADAGCGGSVGARCCPGTGALSRCGDDWLGCYGGTCQCGGVGQVCCRSSTEITCHGGFSCGPAFTCI